MELESSRRDFAYTKERSRVRTASGKMNFSQNSRPYIVLKFSCDPHSHSSSPTQCLFFIGHRLQSRSVYSPLVMASTHAFLCLGYPLTYFGFSDSYFVDFIYDRMYLSTSSARFTAGQSNILHLHILKI